MNSPASQNTDTSKKLVLIVLWFGILSSTAMIRFFVLGDTPQASGFSFDPLMLAALGPFFISVFLRLAVIPRAKSHAALLQFYVLGIAMGECCALVGMFIVPEMADTFFALGVLAILAYIPIGKHFNPGSTEPTQKKVIPES